MPPNRSPAKRPAKKAEGAVTAITLDEMDDWIKILYYGEWGSGKTTDLAHMALGGRTLWINAEGGIKRRPLERVFNLPLGNIEIVPDPRKRARVSFEMLRSLFWSTAERLESEPGSIHGVVFDSLTDIYKVLLEDVTHKEVDRAIAKAERQGVVADDIDPHFIDRSYYGIETEQMREIVRNYRDLPCHLGITALARRDQDDNTGEVLYGPALNPALQTDVLGWVDLVCRTETDTLEDDGEPVYLGHFVTQGVKVAKDRYQCLPRTMVNPTFDRVVAYLNDELTAESDPEIAKLRDRRKAIAEAKKAGRRARQAARRQSAERKPETDNEKDED